MINFSTRTTALGLMCTLLLTLTAAPAAAQFDHLKCYKAKDQKTFKKAQVDLSALQTQFGISEVCKIKPKAKLFCVPVTKTVTSIEEGQDTPFPAEDLAFDRLCYKIECPRAQIPAELVSDQFGSRQLDKFKAAMLCTPAVKGPVPSTTTTTMQTCVDLDLDTYGVGCPNGPDCNDAVSAINPGATEVCDGIDNDCNAIVDDGVAGTGGACSTGNPGICDTGVIECTAGSIVCTQATMASAETCNGLDDDCNGATDDGNPGGGQVCATGNPGVCDAGTTDCQGGQLVCAQATAASAETCNGLDDDCDGVVDNGFDLGTDPSNCGACSNACLGGQTCSAGTCQCPGGQIVCGGSCTDIDNDVQNCGSCGVSCPPLPNSAAECSSSSCGFVCDAGFEDCNASSADGCEVALDSDTSNCGSCGTVCVGGEICSAGSCECPGGQTQCGGTCSNLIDDASNCGACGVACAGGEVCSGGTCVIAP